MESIALIGMSIFDDAAYVGDEPDVTPHLQRPLPDARLDLDAADGATDLVVSAGDKDALRKAELCRTSCGPTNAALDLLRERIVTLAACCSRMIDAVPALVPFHDVILRQAFSSRLPVIDLRLVRTEPDDDANPIEPSGSGGSKIARAIVAALRLPQSPGGSVTSGLEQP